MKVSFSRILAVGAILSGAAGMAHAAQLSSDARSAIPHDVQQLVVIDYRVMQNSPAAMALRGQVMPPELKQLEDALRKSGLNDNNDLEQLAFVLYRRPAIRKMCGRWASPRDSFRCRTCWQAFARTR